MYSFLENKISPIAHRTERDVVFCLFFHEGKQAQRKREKEGKSREVSASSHFLLQLPPQNCCGILKRILLLGWKKKLSSCFFTRSLRKPVQEHVQAT